MYINRKRGILNACLRAALSTILLSFFSSHALAQTTSTLRGTVTLGATGKPIHNALITILQLKRTVDTDDQGQYEFQGVPPGKYDVVAHLDRVPDLVRTVDVTGETTVDFQFELTGVREEVTVTATGSEQARQQLDSISRSARIDRAREEEPGVTRRGAGRRTRNRET